MAHSAHIFASPKNLRFPLSGLPKRRIQPEHHADLTKKLKKYIKNPLALEPISKLTEFWNRFFIFNNFEHQ
jgi:hypothetical protein